MSEILQVVSLQEVLNHLDRDRYLDKRQAAEYLSISERNLDRRLQEIPHFRLGSKTLFKKSEIDRWMEAHRKNRTGPDLELLAEEAVREVLRAAK